MKRSIRGAYRAIGLAAVMAAAGCGTSVYRPAQSAGFELESATEINDEDVRKAFDAKPQLPSQIRVAYYTFDDDHAQELEAMLKSVPQITTTYRIPTLLVTGQRRFDEPAWGAPKSTPPLSIKKLRLMAARARADVLLIFDYGHRIVYSANGLAAFGILILPVLFVPMQDVETESYLDTYVIDTRNGYLYGQVTAKREAGEDYLNVFSDRGSELAESQRDELVAEAGRLLAELLSRTATVAGPAGAEQSGGWPPAGPVPTHAKLRITFGSTGELYINGTRFEKLDQARVWLEEFVRGREASATIRTHAELPHGRVVAVMDLLKSVNVRSMGVEKGSPQSVSSSPTPPPGAPTEPDGGVSSLPNPASGNPSRVTPPPSLPSHGSPTPVSPLPVGP